MPLHEFRMPTLGADMEAGTLVAWNVKPGDAVRRGQVVAVVETQKGAIDVEIWQEGVVEALLVAIGQQVPVGTVLATLSADGEAAQSPPLAMEKPRVEPPIPVAAVPPVSTILRGRAKVSPSARRLAEELGVDLATVQPGQTDGVISRADVERAARLQKAAPAPVATKSDADWHAQMRAAIAAAMSRSKRDIPHYYLSCDIDMTHALAWMEKHNSQRPVTDRLLYAVLYIRALALALREFPEFNGFWINGAYTPGPGIHIGMAVAMRGGGLVAPAIHDADGKSLRQLMADLRDLTGRVRGGRLKSSEMSDPTITLTSLGDQGVEVVHGVIYPPQVALVGFGGISERAWAENGMLACRRVVTATLAADHRASDGHRGALLLGAIKRLLEAPQSLEGTDK